MEMKYEVWLNGCVVASYKQRKKAFDKARELAKKCKPAKDVLYIRDPWRNHYNFV